MCVCPMLRIISPQKAAHNEILVKRQQFNFQCVCLSYVENYVSTKGCTQWDIGKKKLIFDVCVCPMLRIISPQKAAHNEILVKRQQFNFQCVFVLCWELCLHKRLHTMRYW